MAKRTPDDVILRARKLLESGMNSTAVARAIGLSPWRVCRIRAAMSDAPPSRQTKKRIYERCSGCGGMVMVPCRTCGTRTSKT